MKNPARAGPNKKGLIHLRSGNILTHPTRWLQAVPRETRARAWALWRQVRTSGLRDTFAAWAAVFRRTRELAAVDDQAAAIAAGLQECFEAEIRRRLGATRP
jgi:hypothetical protein